MLTKGEAYDELCRQGLNSSASTCWKLWGQLRLGGVQLDKDTSHPEPTSLSTTHYRSI